MGTTVTWEWTGEGGGHSVVHDTDGEPAFDSGDLEATAGTEYEHTFDETGNYRYYCTPHISLEMKGAVIVRE